MNVTVLVKAVPDLSKTRVSRSQGALIFEGAPILNPADLEALECALQKKTQDPSVLITTVTLGEPALEGTLKKMIGMGADGALLVEADQATLDPLQRAEALSAAVRSLKPDLVLSSDGVTGHAVAEILKLASLEIHSVSELPTSPALVVVPAGIFKPRAATLAGIGRSAKIPVQKQTAQPTSTPRSFRILRQFLPDPDASPSRLATATLEQLPPPEWGGIVVVADTQGARLTATSAGTLALASEVAQLLGAKVTVIVPSADAADRAIRYGADEVKVCSPDRAIDQIGAVIDQEHPEVVFWDDQPQHRKAAAVLGARYKTGCVIGAIHAALDAESRHLVLTQPLYEGKLHQEVLVPTRPQLVTVAVAAQVAPVPDASRTGKVIAL